MKLYKNPTANNYILDNYEHDFSRENDTPSKISKLKYSFNYWIKVNIVTLFMISPLFIVLISLLTIVLLKNLSNPEYQSEKKLKEAFNSYLISEITINNNLQDVADNIYNNLKQKSIRPIVHLSNNKTLIFSFDRIQANSLYSKEISIKKEINTNGITKTSIKIEDMSPSSMALIDEKIKNLSLNNKYQIITNQYDIKKETFTLVFLDNLTVKN